MKNEIAVNANSDFDTRVLDDALKTHFGFSSFREGQQEAMVRLMAGRSTVAIFPTGAGKSLCYQLPALLLEGLTVVVSPLIALMKDQVDFLVSHSIPAARMDSSLSREEYISINQRLQNGELKLLYTSPERLGNERFGHVLRQQKIALMAIDEAHCISEWGHNFRPDYLKLAALSKSFKAERILALTATATPEVAVDIAKAFDIEHDDIVQTGFYRPNLNLKISPCSTAQKDKMLLERLQSRPKGPSIVYVTLQKTAEQVALFLKQHGLPARPYHAGLKTDDRVAAQDSFMASDEQIIVATIAFGMGIDKSNIRYVYHYNLPKGLEHYAQEIGRAGRDGKPSTCELLACGDDVTVLENFVYGDTPETSSVKSVVEFLVSQEDEFDLSVYTLSSTHDIRQLVMATLLTYLELEGLIAATTPFYTTAKFQPKCSSQEMLSRLDPEQASFLRNVLRRARKGQTWFTLDVVAVSEAIGETRSRIMVALGYLEDQGDIVLKMSGVRQGYRTVRRPDDLEALVATLVKRFQKREEADIERVRRVVSLTETEGCITQFLLNYFGEKRSDCQHCSRCEGEAASKLPRLKAGSVDSIAWEPIAAVRAEYPEELKSSQQLARFLCGMTSPKTVRARLRKHKLCGTCETVPFGEVRMFVEKRLGV